MLHYVIKVCCISISPDNPENIQVKKYHMLIKVCQYTTIEGNTRKEFLTLSKFE